MLYKGIVFLSHRREGVQGEAWKSVCEESNSTGAEEAAVSPPAHEPLGHWPRMSYYPFFLNC